MRTELYETDDARRASSPLLEVEELRVAYRPRRRRPELVAVDGVSLRLHAGQTLGIVGESGSGKSSLGSAVLGLTPVAGGSIRFLGQDTTRLSSRQRRALAPHMQAVFQDPYGSFNPTKTIGSTLAEPLRLTLRMTAAEAARRVAEVFERVGLPPGTAQRYPGQFSGGQRQRIAIARALTMSPELIVCDEPVSALDLSVQAQVLNLLNDLQRDLGIAYLFISHDLSVVRHMCDHVLVMHRGTVVERGPIHEIYDRPRDPYTRRLLDAAPVPDPAVQRARREARRHDARERGHRVGASRDDNGPTRVRPG